MTPFTQYNNIDYDHFNGMFEQVFKEIQYYFHLSVELTHFNVGVDLRMMYFNLE